MANKSVSPQAEDITDGVRFEVLLPLVPPRKLG